MDINNMDIKKLEYFLHICKYLNITKAAEDLFVSPQGLSLAISRMEKELNTKLFIRSPKGLILTNSGILLQQCAKNIVHEFNLYLEKMHNDNVIYIAGMHQIISLLPNMAQHLLFSLNPAYPVIMVEASSFECEEMLECGEIHFAISCDPLSNTTFHKHRLFDINITSIVNIHSQFSQNDSINLEKLEGVKIAILSPKNKLFHCFINLCRKASFTPEFIFQAGHPSAICEIVRNNLDIVGIIPNYYIKNLDNTDLLFLPFCDADAKTQVYLLKNQTQVLSQHSLEFEKYFVKIVHSGYAKRTPSVEK